MRFIPSISFTVLLLLSFLPVFAQDTVYCVDIHQPDFEHYDLFNQDIEDKKIIILGEFHYMAANSIIQADLLIYLNKHFGVRHLLIEFGRAEAYLYNQYLQTGDEWYLNHTFPGFNRYEEFFSSCEKLYDYNSRLDNGKKLVVHGLDFEREPGLSASMYTLLSAYENNPQVKKLMDSTKIRLDTIGIERDNKDYIYYLRERIPALSLPEDENKKVIDDILSNNSFLSNFSERDKYMAQTFLSLDTANEVYLGQFGVAHTQLNNEYYLVGLLNKLKNYHDKILVINMYFMNSSNIHPFKNLSECPIFLYRFDPSNDKLGAFIKRGQWALVLEDQKGYTQKE